MKKVEDIISELSDMKKYPKDIFYKGNIELLNATKVSIVGSRKPSKYSKEMTHRLSSSLSQNGVCVVSGGAMGIDAIAHMASGASNTIAVLPCGIDIKYPQINKNLLSDIEEEGLLLSQFDVGFKATPWSFVLRNELVVALGEVLVVAEAEIDSGSARSIEFAQEMGKKIFVFPQRIGQSGATNMLLKDGIATAIYDIDEFVQEFSSLNVSDTHSDEFLEFCRSNPTYDEALKRYPDRIFEAELGGLVEIKNGRVYS